MYESKSIVLYIYVIGLFGQSTRGYHFNKNVDVFGNPINNHRSRPYFDTNPMFGAFYETHGSRPIHSTTHHTDIKNVNRPGQDSSPKYHIIVYDNSGVQSESLYSNIKIALTHQHDKNLKKKPATNKDQIHNYNHQRPVTEHNIINSGYVPINKPLPGTVTQNQQQQHFPISNEQMYDYSTTEPVAILGKPVIIPTSELNAGKMDSNTRSKSKSQKQCVQDCQSSSSYRPICGTDNVTYFNEEKFLCAQKCGIDVLMLKRGACS